MQGMAEALHRNSEMGFLYRVVSAFPISCFSLTLLTDAAYWRTSNLLWLHFSEWLLLGGLLFGLLAALCVIVSSLVIGRPPSWPYAVGGLAVLLLAALNSFVHTADGWTAVVPLGILLSGATVFVMIVTAWLGRAGSR